MTTCSILSSVSPADVEYDPFPHVVIRDAYARIDELVSQFPPEREFGDAPGENVACRIGARAALSSTIVCDSDWAGFIRYHVSVAFAREVDRVFRDALERYRWSETWREVLDNEDIGARSTGEYTLSLDCQLTINTPTSGGTTVRDPHVDNPIEVFAGLWYLRDPEDESAGGDLVLYRAKQLPLQYHRSRWGKGSVSEDQVTAVKVIPYQRGTLVFFLNSPVSVHGVTMRGPASVPRRYVNFIGELPDPLFSLGKRGS